MLEIIALVFLTRNIGELATQKGVNAFPWKLKTVLAWFGMEILGAVIGMLLFDNLLMAVCVALPCAFGGYHIVRTLIQRLPDANDQTLEQIGNNLLP
jgi:hypothetical protein